MNGWSRQRGTLLAATCVIVASAVAGCGNSDTRTKPYSEWTRCPPHSGFTKKAHSTMSDTTALTNFQWEHNCTYPWVGATPQMIVQYHDHPDRSD
jgi:hypothetical protein